MYPIGVLFGLGFDTSSEVALLGISAIQAAKGTSIWVILIFPLLFTASMCLLDTTDGALMMALYTRTAAARDPVIVLYYSIILTGITVVVALIIGTIQLLTLIANVANPEGRFWDGVNNAGEHYDIIGKHSSKVLVSDTKSNRRCRMRIFCGVWSFERGFVQAMETVYREI
jgi:nickel/cobalt transporter (NiCoT) family protein